MFDQSSRWLVDCGDRQPFRVLGGRRDIDLSHCGRRRARVLQATRSNGVRGTLVLRLSQGVLGLRTTGVQVVFEGRSND
nr:MAG TPA: hypothetical protein [Caudoviricetes sp.]